MDSPAIDTLRGGCHCGALEIALALSRPPEETTVRACACSFCRAHDARTATDPAGLVVLRARDPAVVARYRFGLGTADFLVCRRCGVYVAAIIDADEGPRATVNVNALADAARFTREAASVDYGGETAEARRGRRAAAWTPARWADSGDGAPGAAL
jgi:hypothetical protein